MLMTSISINIDEPPSKAKRRAVLVSKLLVSSLVSH